MRNLPQTALNALSANTVYLVALVQFRLVNPINISAADTLEWCRF